MFIKSILFLFLNLGLLNLSSAAADLHMHLTIDVPLSPFYSGDLNSPARATEWDSRLKSRIDFDSLEKSDLNLIVAVIYVNPVWGNFEKQFEEQMAELKEFCQKHPQWKIVAEPREAQEEILKGNKVFLLSVEGGWFYKHKEHFVKLMTKYPVRIVTPLHFSDLTRTVGRASKQRGLFAPIQALMDFFLSGKYAGLTPLGEDLFQYLLENKIWIDLSHSSEEVLQEFLRKRPVGYPLLMTHTMLKKYYGTDRGIDESLLKMIAAESGAVGLLPSTEMLINTPTKDTSCEEENPYLVQWKEMVDLVGLKNAYLGSDLNSPVKGLPPPSKSDCAVLPDGLKTAGDLKTLGALEDKDASLHFLKLWAQIRGVSL